MYTVDTDFELNFIRVRLASQIDRNEALAAVQEILLQIEMFKGRGFCILLDFRCAEPFSKEVAEVWVSVAKWAREKGLVKSARLITSPKMQALVTRVAREADNFDIVRNFTDENEAVYWLTHASSRPLVT